MSATLLASPAAERIPLLGRLAIRALRHAGDDRPPALPPIEGLIVRVRGQQERPSWHASTGVYGFVRTPPGPAEIVISDPSRRTLPWAVSATVPDRTAVADAIIAGTPPPAIPALILTVPLRPTAEGALPAGASVWGIAREQDGSIAPLARVSVETVFGADDGRVTTWADDRAAFLLPLPGERAETTRRLTVHTPQPALAEALRRDFLAALPVDLDAMNPDAASAPFTRRRFRLIAPDGTTRERSGNQNPRLPITPGASRWDIELLP